MNDMTAEQIDAMIDATVSRKDQIEIQQMITKSEWDIKHRENTIGFHRAMSRMRGRPEILLQAEEATLRWIYKANDMFGLDMRIANVRFTLTGRVAGWASWRGKNELGVINYNSTLLKENGDRFIKEVVPHEVAHLVTHELHGNNVKPHGKEWKAVMMKLGREPKLYHRFYTGNTKKHIIGQFSYNCKCNIPRYFGKVRHHKVKNGLKVYMCHKCNSVLRHEATQMVYRQLLAEKENNLKQKTENGYDGCFNIDVIEID